MILPNNLSDKINSLYFNLEKKQLKSTQTNLTNKYKNETGNSKNLISNKNESILYAISRMPATYCVIYTLFNDLLNQGLIKDINSVTDIGSGTGAVYFALKNIFQNLDFNLYERNTDMIDVFNILSENKINVNKSDVLRDEILAKSDIVTSSYVLSEMNEADRKTVFRKMLNLSSRYVLIVDTGTPKTYADMLKLIEIAKESSFNIIAPCMCYPCKLKNDYCQFFARVERSSLLRMAKSGTLSYEDEKFFYLLFEKNSSNLVNQNKYRVIRRPKITENKIEFVVCTKNGVINHLVTRKNKTEFKIAKKLKINDIFEKEDAEENEN